MESKLSEEVKFEDFSKNPSLLNVTIDVVGIIAKVGDLKYANGDLNEDTVEILAIRDLHIYDDTFTMVRLILRDRLAENCQHLKVNNDILSLKNVKIQKVQNRFVMTTSKETIVNVNTAAYSALRLKQWFVYNKKDILKNNFMQFKNLSMTPAVPKKEREKNFVSPARPSESPPTKLLRVSPNIASTLQKKDKIKVHSSLPSTPASPSSSPSSPLNLKPDLVNNSNLLAIRAQENIPNENIETINDDNKDLKPICQKENKENTEKDERRDEDVEMREEEKETDSPKQHEHTSVKAAKETNEFDHTALNSKTDVRYETYHTLMHSHFLENVWDEEKDQYLVNFITKNSFNLQNDLAYNKLFTEKPDVFAKITPAILKERVFALSSVKNYLYLMKLCGGDHLTTEKEKDIFIVKVEKLREAMKLIENS